MIPPLHSAMIYLHIVCGSYMGRQPTHQQLDSHVYAQACWTESGRSATYTRITSLLATHTLAQAPALITRHPPDVVLLQQSLCTFQYLKLKALHINFHDLQRNVTTSMTLLVILKLQDKYNSHRNSCV